MIAPWAMIAIGVIMIAVMTAAVMNWLEDGDFMDWLLLMRTIAVGTAVVCCGVFGVILILEGLAQA